jgi:nitroreductase
MDFIELVKKRQSVRDFDGKPVEREVLEKCVEAVRLSPSACNAQPWKFIIVDEPELVKKVAACTYDKLVRFNKFTDDAAAFAVVVMEPGNFTSRAGGAFTNLDYAMIDMGIAVENFCLMAAEEDVGTCILGWSNHEKISKLLGIPEKKEVGLLIAIGRSKSGKIRPKQRKKKEEMRSFNKY